MANSTATVAQKQAIENFQRFLSNLIKTITGQLLNNPNSSLSRDDIVSKIKEACQALTGRKVNWEQFSMRLKNSLNFNVGTENEKEGSDLYNGYVTAVMDLEAKAVEMQKNKNGSGASNVAGLGGKNNNNLNSVVADSTGAAMPATNNKAAIPSLSEIKVKLSSLVGALKKVNQKLVEIKKENAECVRLFQTTKQELDKLKTFDQNNEQTQTQKKRLETKLQEYQHRNKNEKADYAKHTEYKKKIETTIVQLKEKVVEAQTKSTSAAAAAAISKLGPSTGKRMATPNTSTGKKQTPAKATYASKSIKNNSGMQSRAGQHAPIVNAADPNYKRNWLEIQPPTFVQESMDEDGELLEENMFLNYNALKLKTIDVCKRNGMKTVSTESCALLSIAIQHKMRSMMEEMLVNSQHRYDTFRPGTDNSDSTVTADTRRQIKIINRMNLQDSRQRHKEERSMLMKLSKSRAKVMKEDANAARLKQKAKQVRNLEELDKSHQAANRAALAAVTGSRRKVTYKETAGMGKSRGGGKKSTLGKSGFGKESNENKLVATGAGSGGAASSRFRRIILRDLIQCLENDKDCAKSSILYRALLRLK